MPTFSNTSRYLRPLTETFGVGVPPKAFTALGAARFLKNPQSPPYQPWNRPYGKIYSDYDHAMHDAKEICSDPKKKSPSIQDKYKLTDKATVEIQHMAQYPTFDRPIDRQIKIAETLYILRGVDKRLRAIERVNANFEPIGTGLLGMPQLEERLKERFNKIHAADQNKERR